MIHRYDIFHNIKPEFRNNHIPAEVHKLYQCAMPFTAESKNLFLIIQNLLFLEINILVKTQLLYCVT